MNRNSIKLVAGAALVAALALPGAAVAKGGTGGGGGGGTTPTPPAAQCARLTPQNSGVVDKPASHKPITVDFQVTNCGSRAVTVGTTLVGTAQTVTSRDPVEIVTCSTAPYSAPTLTLKPGESRQVSGASTLPYCGYSLWGVVGAYDVEYKATARDTSDGTVLDQQSSWVLHRGGV